MHSVLIAEGTILRMEDFEIFYKTFLKTNCPQKSFKLSGAEYNGYCLLSYSCSSIILIFL